MDTGIGFAGANSNSARDRSFLLHPMTDLARHQKEGPLVLTRGELTRVVDDGGNSFIEGVSGLWSVSLGFHNERLARAAYEQMLKLPTSTCLVSRPRAGDRTGRAPAGHGAGADVEGVFR